MADLSGGGGGGGMVAHSVAPGRSAKKPPGPSIRRLQPSATPVSLGHHVNPGRADHFILLCGCSSIKSAVISLYMQSNLVG